MRVTMIARAPASESASMIWFVSSRRTMTRTAAHSGSRNGEMVARDYVLLDYDIERSRIDAAIAVAAGFESATISPLRDPEWAAVRVMVRRDETNQIMDALSDAGARAIIVTRIHAARI